MKSSNEIEKALYESSNSSISITKKDGEYFNVNQFKDIEKLKENIKAFMNIIIKSKPSVVKGVYVKNISLSTTMGPGIKLDVNSL